jgi:dTDP-4-amino-4,6-dideoxyglucose
MHELSAVAGLHSIATMSGRIAANRANRMVYACHCQSLNGLSLLSTPEGNESNGQYLVLTVDEQQFGLNRDQIVSLLRAEGVFARSYFTPGCHQAEPYRSADFGRHVRVPLDVTETLSKTVLQLPTGPAVAPADAHKVGLLLRLLHQHAAEVQRLWSSSENCLQYHPADPARPPITVREVVHRDTKLREAG